MQEERMQAVAEKDAEKLGMIVKRVSVPMGLEELMEGLTKEVLLKKPKDLYIFASEYFSRLVILREQSYNQKAYTIRTAQSITQLKTSDVIKGKKISPARPIRHLSRQLSMRNRSPVAAKTSQSDLKRNTSQTSRARRPTDEKNESAPNAPSKATSKRGRSISTNKKDVTPRSTCSVQSTPREVRQRSTLRQAKPATSQLQNFSGKKTELKAMNEKKPDNNKGKASEANKDKEVLDSDIWAANDNIQEVSKSIVNDDKEIKPVNEVELNVIKSTAKEVIKNGTSEGKVGKLVNETEKTITSTDKTVLEVANKDIAILYVEDNKKLKPPSTQRDNDIVGEETKPVKEDIEKSPLTDEITVASSKERFDRDPDNANPKVEPVETNNNHSIETDRPKGNETAVELVKAEGEKLVDESAVNSSKEKGTDEDSTSKNNDTSSEDQSEDKLLKEVTGLLQPDERDSQSTENKPKVGVMNIKMEQMGDSDEVLIVSISGKPDSLKNSEESHEEDTESRVASNVEPAQKTQFFRKNKELGAKENCEIIQAANSKNDLRHAPETDPPLVLISHSVSDLLNAFLSSEKQHVFKLNESTFSEIDENKDRGLEEKPGSIEDSFTVKESSHNLLTKDNSSDEASLEYNKEIDVPILNDEHERENSITKLHQTTKLSSNDSFKKGEDIISIDDSQKESSIRIAQNSDITAAKIPDEGNDIIETSKDTNLSSREATIADNDQQESSQGNEENTIGEEASLKHDDSVEKVDVVKPSSKLNEKILKENHLVFHSVKDLLDFDVNKSFVESKSLTEKDNSSGGSNSLKLIIMESISSAGNTNIASLEADSETLTSNRGPRNKRSITGEEIDEIESYAEKVDDICCQEEVKLGKAGEFSPDPLETPETIAQSQTLISHDAVDEHFLDNSHKQQISSVNTEEILKKVDEGKQRELGNSVDSNATEFNETTHTQNQMSGSGSLNSDVVSNKEIISSKEGDSGGINDNVSHTEDNLKNGARIGQDTGSSGEATSSTSMRDDDNHKALVPSESLNKKAENKIVDILSSHNEAVNKSDDLNVKRSDSPTKDSLQTQKLITSKIDIDLDLEKLQTVQQSLDRSAKANSTNGALEKEDEGRDVDEKSLRLEKAQSSATSDEKRAHSEKAKTEGHSVDAFNGEANLSLKDNFSYDKTNFTKEVDSGKRQDSASYMAMLETDLGNINGSANSNSKKNEGSQSKNDNKNILSLDSLINKDCRAEGIVDPEDAKVEGGSMGTVDIFRSINEDDTKEVDLNVKDNISHYKDSLENEVGADGRHNEDQNSVASVKKPKIDHESAGASAKNESIYRTSLEEGESVHERDTILHPTGLLSPDSLKNKVNTKEENESVETAKNSSSLLTSDNIVADKEDDLSIKTTVSHTQADAERNPSSDVDLSMEKLNKDIKGSSKEEYISIRPKELLSSNTLKTDETAETECAPVETLIETSSENEATKNKYDLSVKVTEDNLKNEVVTETINRSTTDTDHSIKTSKIDQDSINIDLNKEASSSASAEKDICIQVKNHILHPTELLSSDTSKTIENVKTDVETVETFMEAANNILPSNNESDNKEDNALNTKDNSKNDEVDVEKPIKPGSSVEKLKTFQKSANNETVNNASTEKCESVSIKDKLLCSDERSSSEGLKQETKPKTQDETNKKLIITFNEAGNREDDLSTKIIISPNKDSLKSGEENYGKPDKSNSDLDQGRASSIEKFELSQISVDKTANGAFKNLLSTNSFKNEPEPVQNLMNADNHEAVIQVNGIKPKTDIDQDSGFSVEKLKTFEGSAKIEAINCASKEECQNVPTKDKVLYSGELLASGDLRTEDKLEEKLIIEVNEDDSGSKKNISFKKDNLKSESLNDGELNKSNSDPDQGKGSFVEKTEPSEVSWGSANGVPKKLSSTDILKHELGTVEKFINSADHEAAIQDNDIEPKTGIDQDIGSSVEKLKTFQESAKNEGVNSAFTEECERAPTKDEVVYSRELLASEVLKQEAHPMTEEKLEEKFIIEVNEDDSGANKKISLKDYLKSESLNDGELNKSNSDPDQGKGSSVEKPEPTQVSVASLNGESKKLLFTDILKHELGTVEKFINAADHEAVIQDNDIKPKTGIDQGSGSSVEKLKTFQESAKNEGVNSASTEECKSVSTKDEALYSGELLASEVIKQETYPRTEDKLEEKFIIEVNEDDSGANKKISLKDYLKSESLNDGELNKSNSDPDQGKGSSVEKPEPTQVSVASLNGESKKLLFTDILKHELGTVEKFINAADHEAVIQDNDIKPKTGIDQGSGSSVEKLKTFQESAKNEGVNSASTEECKSVSTKDEALYSGELLASEVIKQETYPRTEDKLEEKFIIEVNEDDSGANKKISLKDYLKSESVNAKESNKFNSDPDQGKGSSVEKPEPSEVSMGSANGASNKLSSTDSFKNGIGPVEKLVNATNNEAIFQDNNLHTKNNLKIAVNDAVEAKIGHVNIDRPTENAATKSASKEEGESIQHHGELLPSDIVKVEEISRTGDGPGETIVDVPNTLFVSNEDIYVTDNLIHKEDDAGKAIIKAKTDDVPMKNLKPDQESIDESAENVANNMVSKKEEHHIKDKIKCASAEDISGNAKIAETLMDPVSNKKTPNREGGVKDSASGAEGDVTYEKEPTGSIRIGKENTFVKDEDKEEIKRRSKIGDIEQVASVIEVVKNIYDPKSSSESSSVTTVREFLNKFLQSEQEHDFFHNPTESVDLTAHKINEKSEGNNRKNISKLTFKSKQERSLSETNNVVNTQKKSLICNARRARSVGMIRMGDLEPRTKIPVPARRSAGRRPLVRQLDADSKELEEKLSFKKSSSRSSGNDSADKESSKKGINGLKKSAPNSDDVLIAKAILKGVEGAEKHIEHLNNKVTENVAKDNKLEEEIANGKLLINKDGHQELKKTDSLLSGVLKIETTGNIQRDDSNENDVKENTHIDANKIKDTEKSIVDELMKPMEIVKTNDAEKDAKFYLDKVTATTEPSNEDLGTSLQQHNETKAAVQIQSAWRGFIVRKMMKKPYQNESVQEKAIVLIQAVARGFLNRLKYNKLKARNIQLSDIRSNDHKSVIPNNTTLDADGAKVTEAEATDNIDNHILVSLQAEGKINSGTTIERTNDIDKEQTAETQDSNENALQETASEIINTASSTTNGDSQHNQNDEVGKDLGDHKQLLKPDTDEPKRKATDLLKGKQIENATNDKSSSEENEHINNYSTKSKGNANNLKEKTETATKHDEDKQLKMHKELEHSASLRKEDLNEEKTDPNNKAASNKKPDFYRSNTVIEPMVIKKNVAHLGEDSGESEEQNEDEKDNNNNKPEKKEETELERDVRSAIQGVLDASNKQDAKLTPLEQEADQTVIGDVDKVLNRLPEVPKHVIPKTVSQKTFVASDLPDLNITNKNLSYYQSRSENDENAASLDIPADDVSSIGSIDSVVTVILKPKHETPNKEENETDFKVTNKRFLAKALTTSALEDHVELIDQVQNSLLDQLSGKNLDTTSKFDIEQLRKELHDAGTLYQTDEATSPLIDHDPEVMEYLYDFEPEDDSAYESRAARTPLRELPDIAEEEDAELNSRKVDSEHDKTNFCGIEMLKNIEGKPLQDHVEVFNAEYKSNEIITNDDEIGINKDRQHLLHASELHDAVTVPVGMVTSLQSDSYTELDKASKLKHTGEFHDTVVIPLSSGDDVKIKNAPSEDASKSNQGRTMDSGNQTSNQQAPAGVEVVTSRRRWQDGVDVVEAQASLRDTAPAKPESGEPFTHQSPPRSAEQAMESENNNINKRNNAITNNNNNKVPVAERTMETEAATKIQAGFRGYQVRKQMKAKGSATDQKRHLRKRSSRENMKDPDLEEKSAVKIQAGVRGFLVRRRQKKQVNSSASA